MSQLDLVKTELIQSDEGFRSLYEEHREYKRKLAEMQAKSLPSQEDEIEIKRMKLHKLALKDKMEAMVLDRMRSEPVEAASA